MSAAGNLQIKPHAQAPTGKDPRVRTLKNPPEIWDLVHETRAEFKPRSALVGHLKTLNPWGVALVLLIVGGVAGVLFMTLRDSSASPTSAPPAQAQSVSNQSDVIPQSAPANPTESSPVKSTNTAAPATSTAASTIDESRTNVAAPPAPAGTAEIKIDEPKISVAAPAVSSDSKVTARPRPQSSTSPTKASGETVAAGKKDKAQASGMFANASPTAARPENKDAFQTSANGAAKSEKEKAANATPTKKEADKAQSSQLIAPPKASATPKAKVIQWP